MTPNPLTSRVSGSLVKTSNGRGKSAGFEVAVVSFFVDAADILGVPKSVAAIYGICFATPRPLSFADIHERLDISQGSISQGLRLLREVGALRVVHATEHAGGVHPKLGERRDFYEPDLELRKLVTHYLENRLSSQLELSHGALQQIAQQIPGDAKDGPVLEFRVEQLEKWHRKTRALLPLAKTFFKLP